MLWYQSIPVWLQKLFPQLTWQLPGADSKDVYLTFDDGPHPEISLWVCDELEKRGMKATFFCVGNNAIKYPETLKTLRSKGHMIGNHTMQHMKGWESGNPDYFRDIDACNEVIGSKLFRPPYGRITLSQIRHVSRQYRIVMWSLLSCDFDRSLDCSKALLGLRKKTRNGSIVVFHDSEKSEKNLKCLLPDYLDFLQSEGYICKTF